MPGEEKPMFAWQVSYIGGLWGILAQKQINSKTSVFMLIKYVNLTHLSYCGDEFISTIQPQIMYQIGVNFL